MKKLILILLLTSLSFGNFLKEDDKQAHIAATTLISFSVAAIASKQGFSKQESFWIGVGTAMLVGVAKEVYDKNRGGKFDGRDILADGIGSTLGVFTLIKIKYFVNKVLQDITPPLPSPTVTINWGNTAQVGYPDTITRRHGTRRIFTKSLTQNEIDLL